MHDEPIFPPFAPTLPGAIEHCVTHYGDRPFLLDVVLEGTVHPHLIGVHCGQ